MLPTGLCRVRNRVEVVIAGDTPVAPAEAKATRTIPIELAGIADPVGPGLVVSRARPGGNITAGSRNLPALAGKKLERLLQAAPGTTRFGFLGSAADPATPSVRRQQPRRRHAALGRGAALAGSMCSARRGGVRLRAALN